MYARKHNRTQQSFDEQKPGVAWVWEREKGKQRKRNREKKLDTDGLTSCNIVEHFYFVLESLLTRELDTSEIEEKQQLVN